MKAKDIYKAIALTLNAMTAAYDIYAPVLSSDITEKPVYPSLKIEMDNDQSRRDTRHLDFNSFLVRIYYFPPNRHACRDAHLEMKDALKDFFKDTISVNEFDLHSEDGISFTVSDGILIAEVAYEWYEQRPEEDQSEIMQTLNINI